MTQPQEIQPLDQIRVWDRRGSEEITERVYGDFFVRLLYGNKTGQLLTEHFLVKKPLSQLMGLYYNSILSRRNIGPFIQKFQINMDEFQTPPMGFQSFNEFFIREFEPGARRFSYEKSQVCAPAEGRYLAFENFSLNQTFTLKGAQINVQDLLHGHSVADEFDGGTCLVVRLCPVDYHRFHFHDSGRVRGHFKIPGKLHSVNPMAFNYDPRVFLTNYREATVFDSTNTGTVLYIEVGALGVGSIKQKFRVGQSVSRGDQKGWFEFGGSSVIVLFQKGRVKIADDILEKTRNQVECLIRLGEVIGSASPQD